MKGQGNDMRLIVISVLILIMVIYIYVKKTYCRQSKHLIVNDALLSCDELMRHASDIAKNHQQYKKKKGCTYLFSRLDDNYRFISNVYKQINEYSKMKLPLCPGCDWLLDNFYIIEEQYKDLKQNNNPRIFKDLNLIKDGYLKNYPRVFVLALELVSHTDGRLDKKQLIDFITSYQSKAVLSMTELWALSLMLRTALIENIRHVCEKIISTQSRWNDAEKLRGKSQDEIINLIKRYTEHIDYSQFAYIEHALRIIKKEDINLEIVLDYLSERLLELDTNIEAVIKHEHQEQSNFKVTIGNCITSLRLAIALDWNDVFESLSTVEKALRNDPSGIYPLQDFETRNYYRREIGKIAKQIDRSETLVAKKVLELANIAFSSNEEIKKGHIGYYIVGSGRNLLFKEFGINKAEKRASLSTYLTPFIAIIGAITSEFSFYTYFYTKSLFFSIVAALIAFIPASDISNFIINYIFTHILHPSFLPKLELGEGIPEDKSTIVIVPTVLPDEKRVKELIDKLEVTYIANKENNLFFALAGDLKDSDRETLETDQLIIDTALGMISDLNRKYARGNDIFYFFLRKRVFNKSQKRWMGWERKRGAIVEFNELIKGSKDTSYHVISGDIKKLGNAKYVITLDADTIMPIGAARKLIGTISHPLNQAVYNEDKGIVTEGYGIIQPRIGINIESVGKSKFTCIFAGHGGIDPYSNAVSNVYQDLYGEGIFTGKGIYDIDIYRKALNDSIPENTVLSHDLLEGSYIRCGLAADIELIDGYPEKYSSYMMRLHRWTRGDWQLLPWLSDKVKNKKGNLVKNPLSNISKWKILDNLRRSLLSPCLLLTVFLGLTLLPGGILWIGLVIITIFLPLLTYFIDYILLKQYKSSRQRLNGNIVYGFKSILYQSWLTFMFLPYQAYAMSEAIVKTLYRVYISKNNLLEWVTAADAEKISKNDLKSYIRRMSPSLILSLFLVLLAVLIKPSNIYYALLIAAVWAASPFEAYNISRPLEHKKPEIKEEDKKLLLRIARKTWDFYDDFAGAEDNYLPPDNYQETPIERVAHRTSPTNIGFLLISILSACDFGFISIEQMTDRIDKTISTIEKLEKWKGHLYNWYDTRTLELLRPRYISTVDSGNFVGYLMVLREGLLEYLKKPLIDKRIFYGIEGTLSAFPAENHEVFEAIEEFKDKNTLNIEDWIDFLNNISSILNTDSVSEKVINTIEGIKAEIYYFLPVLDDNLKASLYNSYPDLKTVFENINCNLSLEDLRAKYEKLLNIIDNILKNDNINLSERQQILQLKDIINSACTNANIYINKINNIAVRIDRLVEDTRFSDLYDKKRGLFSIGYNAEDDRLTNSYYDLLASEARLASYIAIARREVPVSHWFKLGRSLVLINSYESLVSWTGTMFEYLMPALVMKYYKNTLLSETYGTSIKAQIKYGKDRNVPWGTSESGFYTFDLALNYQYKAFGVPDLGLKRGLVNDMVVSPYSTMLALPFLPEASIENLKRLISNNIEGKYGLYEAIDYTPDRLPYNTKYALVESFMAHHQGMILISLNNFLNNNIMVERFHSNPVVKAGEFLLQEKIPLRVIITKEHKETVKPFSRDEHEDAAAVRTAGYDTLIPVCHCLSNGYYSLMINNGGSGYSRTSDLQITRWREDTVSRRSGYFFYLRDINSNRIWSAAFEPLNIKPDKYEAKFSQDKAEFLRQDGNIETHTEICISPEDNCEIRKITIKNHSSDYHTIECTSYFEVVLSAHQADMAHPAFNNLFIRTEEALQYNTILALRRQREENKNAVWAFHTLTVEGECLGNIEYETDRYKFIGRNRDISNPYALFHPLSNTSGAALDPVMSLRRRVRIEPGKSVTLSYITGSSESREAALEMAKKYSENTNIERAFELAYIRSQMETRYLELNESEITTFDDMISHIIYSSPLRQKFAELIKNNTKGQQGLWPYGISGDVPIVLVSIKRTDDIEIVKDMLKAHGYWRTRGLKVDLVILNEDESSYLQPLQDLLRDIAYTSNARNIIDSAGGVFIRNASNMPEEDITLLYSAARLVIKAELGSIKSQIDISGFSLPDIDNKILAPSGISFKNKNEMPQLLFFNGYGGFDIENREYVIRLKEDTNTPAPWANVVSNKNFGFIVTESGSGYTFAENSRENKLTPWSNDPVSDPPGEVIYVRDEDSGEFWSITPSPVREKECYTICHGHGYSRFSHCSHGIEQDMVVFVPVSDSVKVSAIRLNNPAIYKRRLSVYYYIKPVMGVSDQITEQYITTEFDKDRNMMLIRNSYNCDYPGGILLVSSSEKAESYTGDRMEFLGPYGSLSSPLALNKEHLSGRTGSGFNPCCAIQYRIELEPRSDRELVLLLGYGKDLDDAVRIAERYKNISNCRKAFEEVRYFWQSTLGTIQVSTPDDAMNIMLNSCLLYQTAACRLWARSAFYQSGGAFGFRDQLQDVLSLVYAMPDAARKQILIHSSHQFVEGDVLHWWHPGIYDRGIRTKFSDDLVWLPYVTAEYIEKTGDYEILNEVTGYVEDAPLKEDEDERYGIPKVSDVKSTLYEHCIKAIDRALKFGPNGIPLMGSGDWNDGMNAVGRKGRGESIWLGFFLYSTLNKFIPLCRLMEDYKKAAEYIKASKAISSAIEENAWDGEWYRRSYFDNGTPLGSSLNSECKIDSIAQSWAVISGAAKPERAARAMKSVENYLINKDAGLILLFTPPFDRGDLRPGYIRGYVPGVRENGGQYTHASTWVIYAYAIMGYGDMAHYLFSTINPINHALTRTECLKYKVEPYVMAADVYAAEPHTGRGGWTWYTGSSSWMYKVGLEKILGFTKKGNTLSINPCIPSEWKEYTIRYRFGETIYNILVQNPNSVNTGIKSMSMDGRNIMDKIINLIDDKEEHNIKIIMG